MNDSIKNLSVRQIQILKSIIEEYINTAEAVGSETLEKKHNMGVSPATIRNEMAKLTSLKLLKQPHTSSGRVPTPEALKYYVENLMKNKDLSVAEEVAVKERVWDFRQQAEKLLREATKVLADKTHALALSATDKGDLFYSGAGNILDMPEFYDFELTHHLFTSLDQFQFWWDLLNIHDDPFYILLGEEVANESILSQCGFVYMKFSTPYAKGAIGVIGPSRLNYQSVIPAVRYIGNLIGELSSGW
jgi:transcriptional regulator of heat shock response